MMKRKIFAFLLGLMTLMNTFTLVYADNDSIFVDGEYVDFNTVTKHIEPNDTNIAITPDIGFFSLDEPAYQSNVGALVVVLAFSDTDEASYQGLGSKLDDLLNGENDSMKKLFADVSGDKVTYQAQIPQLDNNGNLVVVKDEHPRAYYERYMQYLNPDGFQFNSQGIGETAEGRRRLYEFITTALDNIPKEDLDIDILDGNGDGEVDNVITLFPDPKGQWADLLWPMSTSIADEEAYPLLKDDSGEAILGVGQITFQNYGVNLTTLYHETCHSLGLRDVYNYVNKSRDLGNAWTPMSSGLPYGMNSIEREGLGWLTPQVIVPTEEAVEYTLKALSEKDGNAYKINTHLGQSIYLEYRKKDDNLEKEIPGSGLLAWRCDKTLMNANGNAYGPPYYQYLYRPFGTESAMESTDNAAFSQNSDRTAMGVGTSMPLYVPKYDDVVVTEENPANANEMVFTRYDGAKVVFRLNSLLDSNICIYDIEEIEETNEIKFKLKLGKSDTVVSDPAFSHNPGNYTEDISLELTSSDGGEIYYTLDGTEPTMESNLYENPINISGAVTVKAACFVDGVRSNVVEGEYYCYTNESTGSLPYYDGTGNNRFAIAVPYDVVRIAFEDLNDETVSGTIVIVDVESNSGFRFYAKDLFGKVVRMPTNGTLMIMAETQNAKFKIKGYSGHNEPVSNTNASFSLLEDGKTARITTMLRNNSRTPQNAKTIIALYDDNNRLVQSKMINEALYNSEFSYQTGADFELVGNEKKCNIYVWNNLDTIIPLTYEFGSRAISQN